MRKLFLSLAAAVMTVCGMVGMASLSPAAYADVMCANGRPAGSLAECYQGVDSSISGNNLTDTMNTIINVVIGLVGFVAVVMMIMGGISFVISQGDSAKVTKARNTILYGVVGLIVALLAFAIVNFVLSNVFN